MCQWVNASISFGKDPNQRWHKKEARKKTTQNRENHGPVSAPNSFKSVSNSSPERFFSVHFVCLVYFVSLVPLVYLVNLVFLVYLVCLKSISGDQGDQ